MKTILLILSFIADAVSATNQVPEVQNLKCEYLTDPLGIVKKITRATAFVSGLGLYEWYLNGIPRAANSGGA